MGFFSKLFGTRKPRKKIIRKKRKSVKRISVSRALEKRPRVKVAAKKEPRIFVFYDKDDPSVPGVGYHWYVIAAPNRGSAKRALEIKVGKDSEADRRMRGPLPQNQVSDFLKNDAPREFVTRLKGA